MKSCSGEGNKPSRIDESIILTSLPMVAFCDSGPRSILAARHLESLATQ